MRVGVHVGRFDWPGGTAAIGPRLRQIAVTADEAGLDSLWVMDHLFQLGTDFGAVHGPVEAPMLEGYATISHLAAVTSRIRLGLMVTCPLFRHPGVLVKTASTVDVLSGGRTYLGLGAGWYEREAVGLGMVMPSWTERFERLEETLQIAHRMGCGDTSPFEGTHYRLAEPLNSPRPPTRPPIMIGGDGERRTLRLVARYADAWNVVVGPPLALPEFGVLARTGSRDEYDTQVRKTLTHKLDVLRRHCDDAGRPFDAIEKTVVTYIRFGSDAMSPPDVVDLCGMYHDLGFRHVVFNMHDVHELEPLQRLGHEVRPAVAALP